MRRWLLLLILVAPLSFAAIDAFEFRRPVDEVRYHALTAELRCPKCQNQNIADSDAPIAKDLRREVYRLINSGASDTEIVDYLVSRYGEFVLYRPKVNAQTWFLWYGPYLVLGLGVVVILAIVFMRKANRRTRPGAKKVELTAQERERLDAVLNEDNKG